MNRSLYSGESEITSLTMAILPRKTENGGIGSHILESEAEYFLEESPSKVIDTACKFFGQSLAGLQNGTKEVINMSHKLPISIDVWSGMYFIPTLSATNPKCAWINHTHIESVERVGKKQTKVNFNEELSAMVEVSYGSLMNQINRTAQFRFILDKRIKGLR